MKMPRSSRHKSSKHSSREARDYSDSEKDSRLKEKKFRDDGGSNSNRHLKEPTSGEKRKTDSQSVDISKDLSGGGDIVIVDYVDEYVSFSSSKKQKEKEDDDRWTGGDNDNNHSLSKNESKSDTKRSTRRLESLIDGEEGKRSGIKVESRLHRSERKERGAKDGDLERDRKTSNGERLVDGITGNVVHLGGNEEGNRKQGYGEERGVKHGISNTGKVTCFSAHY